MYFHQYIPEISGKWKKYSTPEFMEGVWPGAQTGHMNVVSAIGDPGPGPARVLLVPLS
jgi:hypothetical protein